MNYHSSARWPDINYDIRALTESDATAYRTLRLFMLKDAPNAFSSDWQSAHTTQATGTSLGIHYTDFPIEPGQRAPIRFTFFWPEKNRWEGQDYTVGIEPAG